MLSKKEIDEVYRELRYGDRIIITRDLSRGEKLDDMIQTLSVQVLAENRMDMKDLLYSYPVLEIKHSKDERFSNYRKD